MIKNRRDFLLNGGSALLTHFICSGFANKAWSIENRNSHIWLILASSETDSSKKYADSSLKPGKLKALNLETKEIVELDVPFFGHELIANPRSPNIAFSCVKSGNKGALVDFKSKKVLQIIDSPVGIRFSGHATWAKDSKHLYISAQNDNTREGNILVYNCENLELENQIESGGLGPHQLMLKNESELIVLNLDSLRTAKSTKVNSVFGFIDLKNSKLSKSIPLSRRGLSHFAYDSKNESYFSGGYLKERDGLVGESVLEKVTGQDTFPIEIPSSAPGKLHGVLVSLQISSLNPALMAFTVTDAGYVALYDLDKKQFLVTDTSLKLTKGVFFSTTRSDILFVNDDEQNLHTFKVEKSRAAWQLKHIDQINHLGNGAHLNKAEWA